MGHLAETPALVRVGDEAIPRGQRQPLPHHDGWRRVDPDHGGDRRAVEVVLEERAYDVGALDAVAQGAGGAQVDQQARALLDHHRRQRTEDRPTGSELADAGDQDGQVGVEVLGLVVDGHHQQRCTGLDLADDLHAPDPSQRAIAAR